MSDNNVTFVGNATREPELRYTTGGRGVASFGLAVNRRWMNKQTQEWEEEVSFFNVTAWGDLGENVAASVQKGSRVVVSGRMQQRKYTTREGEDRTTMEVIADDIGASMRWATVVIERTERTGPSDGGGRASRSAPKQADPVYGDEEPF